LIPKNGGENFSSGFLHSVGLRTYQHPCIISQHCKNNIHKDVVLVRNTLTFIQKLQHKPKEVSSKLKLKLQHVTQIPLTTKLKMHYLFRSDGLLLHYQSTVQLNAVLFQTSNVLK
jgi:hypothetical protein